MDYSYVRLHSAFVKPARIGVSTTWIMFLAQLIIFGFRAFHLSLVLSYLLSVSRDSSKSALNSCGSSICSDVLQTRLSVAAYKHVVDLVELVSIRGRPRDPVDVHVSKFGTSNNQIVRCSELNQSTTIIVAVAKPTVTAMLLAVHWLPTVGVPQDDYEAWSTHL